MNTQKFEELFQAYLWEYAGLVKDENLCRSVCKSYVDWLDGIERTTEKPLDEFLELLNDEERQFFLMGRNGGTPILALQTDMDCLVDKDNNVLKLHEQPEYLRIPTREFMEKYCDG